MLELRDLVALAYQAEELPLRRLQAASGIMLSSRCAAPDVLVQAR